MKAIIMAGGKGTRLRPVCDKMPKPMTRLLGRPLLEHITELLCKHGFNDLCLTLGHKPESITEHFGDGSQFGVSMQYRVENQPLGTAGGVRACSDFYGEDDFLVISGDAACDFDLSSLYQIHKERHADVTMALFSHPEPLRYGTVLTDNDMNIVSFIEKPRWERVVTDLVNTGIYMLSPRVMEMVPKGIPFDFARDLFPLLSEENFKMIGIPMEGYWCDIGDTKSYLNCCMDALNGRLNINMPQRFFDVRGKRYCYENHGELADIADSSIIIPPCLICEGAIIEKGAVIANSIIHANSKIGAYSRIISSVIDGAKIDEACIIDGTIVCDGARLYPQTLTRSGDVIAPGVGESSEEPLLVAQPTRRAKGLCRELACSGRARLMREMSNVLWEVGADFSDGITVRDGNCKVHISPLAEEEAISVEAIGGRESDRLSLCQKYSALAESFGGKSRI